jgi:hypothetical protein
MPVETTAAYVRIRIRDPERFEPATFRTVRAGSHRVVLGVLKGEHAKTGRRRRIHVQAILHPRRELVAACRGCAGARGRAA